MVPGVGKSGSGQHLLGAGEASRGRLFDGRLDPAPCSPHRRPGSAPTQPAVRPAGQLAPAVMPRGERPWTEPAGALAGPGTGTCGPTGQASELQPGAQASGTGESPPPSGRSQREQHTQGREERGDHRPGAQPQQAQAHAQPHQPQRGHTGTATGTGEPGAPPARYPTGSPTGGAHSTRDAARALLDPLRCSTLPSPAARWATTRPEERAAIRWAAIASVAPPARSAREPLPPAAAQPAIRTATAPSSAPARIDSPLPGEVVIAPSRHGAGGTHLTHHGRDRFPRASASVHRAQHADDHDPARPPRLREPAYQPGAAGRPSPANIAPALRSPRMN